MQQLFLGLRINKDALFWLFILTCKFLCLKQVSRRTHYLWFFYFLSYQWVVGRFPHFIGYLRKGETVRKLGIL